MSQHITVIEYSPLWKNRYKEESLLIRANPENRVKSPLHCTAVV